VDIFTDRVHYISGSDAAMDVGLKVRSGGQETRADVFIRITYPGGSPTYYYYGSSFGLAPRPAVKNWLVTDWGPKTILHYRFAGDEPAGEYLWEAALVEPGTGNIIGQIDSTSFTLEYLEE